MVYQNLDARLRTGVILAALAAALLLVARLSCVGAWLLMAVAALAVGLSACEAAAICARDKRRRLLAVIILLAPAVWAIWRAPVYGICCSAGALALPALVSELIISTFCSCIAALLCIFISERKTLAELTRQVAELLLLLLLIGFGGGALVALTQLPAAAGLISWLIITVAVNDITAYFVGSRIRGPLLAPIVSPGKTVSGAIGGVVGGLVAGLSGIVLLGLSPSEALLGGFLIVVAAQCGDLAKSVVKRIHGVKDSGTILPGHGGILDRIDGILLGAPVLLLLPWP